MVPGSSLKPMRIGWATLTEPNPHQKYWVYDALSTMVVNKPVSSRHTECHISPSQTPPTLEKVESSVWGDSSCEYVAFLFFFCLVPIPPPTVISPSTRSLRFHSLWVLKTVDGEARRTPINELAGGASTESDLVQGPGWFWIFGGDNRRWVQKTWIDWNRVIVIGVIINYANTSDKPELLHFIDCTNRRVIKQNLLFGISSTGRSFLAIVVQTSIFWKQII